MTRRRLGSLLKTLFYTPSRCHHDVILHHTTFLKPNGALSSVLFMKAAKGTVHRAGVGACADTSEVYVRVLVF